MNALPATLFSSKPRFGVLALTLVAASTVCLATAAPTIKVVSGASQKTVYASSFASPLVVSVTDPVSKLPLSGYQVDFTPGAGIGLSSPTAITGANGQASVTATGLAAGSYTVVAQVDGYAKDTATFNGLGVGKVALTIVPTNVTSVVSLIPALTGYTLTGFINNDTQATVTITGAPVLTTPATAKSIAGTYGIHAAAGTLSTQNYSFVGGAGKLTLAGLQACGILGPNASGWLKGTYAFNLYNQQGGYTGVMTADGVSKLQAEALFNQSNTASPALATFTGIYEIGNGERGSMALLQSQTGVAGPAQVSNYCFAIDHIVNGVANSGRIIAANSTGMAEAGSFYLYDGSVTSPASLQGTYVVSLQGTSLDLATSTTLDGNGNVTGGLADVEDMTMVANTPTEQYNPKLPVTGAYVYEPELGGGLLTINYNNQQVNFAFVAPTNKHLLLMTEDDATNIPNGWTSTEPLYFGDAKLRTSAPISAATLTGNLNMRLQGVDPTVNSTAPTLVGQEGVIAEAGGFNFDGVGTFQAQGLFVTLDGQYVTTLDYDTIQSTLTYTVDPATGRFESLDRLTNSCVVCGYIVNSNELDAVVTQTGLPLFATFETAATAPLKTKVSDLNGAYSVGSMALISPLVGAWEGILRCDGKGTFQWAADSEIVPTGLFSNLALHGTYTAVGGGYAMTLYGDSSPDFYVFLDANGHGSMIPTNLATTYSLPMLDINVMNPPAI